jgi:hypothetical protein
MLGEDNNIKDTNTDLSLVVKDSYPPISYTKSNKLIMALFMVTDTIDKDEPLRNKLRALGMEIISDINSSPLKASSKIIEIVSLLEIASAINLISEMNCNILKQEFIKLAESIREYGKLESKWFEEFLPPSNPKRQEIREIVLGNKKFQSIGHEKSSKTEQLRMNIGLQKGSTLMKALSDKASVLSDNFSPVNNFDILKKQRREDIVRIIKTDNKGFTITDIKTKAQATSSQTKALASCSEKTLQRELISMVKDGVLYKTGEKRWSRYFIS